MTSMCIGKVREVTGRFKKKNYGKLVDSHRKIIVTIDEKKTCIEDISRKPIS